MSNTKQAKPKRLLSLFLALTMVLGMFPVMSMTASAEEMTYIKHVDIQMTAPKAGMTAEEYAATIGVDNKHELSYNNLVVDKLYCYRVDDSSFAQVGTDVSSFVEGGVYQCFVDIVMNDDTGYQFEHDDSEITVLVNGQTLDNYDYDRETGYVAGFDNDGYTLTYTLYFTATSLNGCGTKDDPYIVTAYDDLRDLVVNAPSGGTQYIKLGSDIISSDTNNNYSLTLSAFGNQNVVLDLAGYTLKRSANSTDTAFIDIKGGSMTINDSVGTGKVIGDLSRYTGPFLIRVLNDGKLTINGGQYENKGTGDVVRIEAPKGGSVTINGGTFLDPPKSDSYDVYTLFYRSGDLDINGGIFYGWIYNERLDDYNVWITNCTVYGMLRNNGAAWGVGEYGLKYYMPEAAVVTVNGEILSNTDTSSIYGETIVVYTPVGINGNPYIVTDYEELLELMKSTPNNTTRYIKLGSDISYSASTNGTALNLSNDFQSVDLDLNGYTVSRSGITADSGIVNLRIGSLTIRDSSSAGTGKMTSSVSGGSGQATVYVSSGGKLTIENGTFEVTNGTYPEAIWTQGGTTQINGGTFISTKAGGSAATFEMGNVTVDGGTFITNDGDPNAGFGIYVGGNANVIFHSCTAIGGPRGTIAFNGTKIPEGYFYYATTIDGKSAGVVMPNDGTSKDKPIFVNNFDQLKAIHRAPTDGTPFYIALNADEAYSTETNYIYGVEVVNGQNVILDLRGHTLHVRLYNDDMITVFGGGTLTINDSVGGGALITEQPVYESSKLLNVIRISGAGKLTVNGGSFQNRGYGRCMSVSGENAEVILNGGEFLSTRSPAKGTYNVELQYGSMTINYAHIYDSLYNARKADNFTINGLLFQSFGEPGVIKQSTGSSCVGSKYLEDHINPTSTVTVDGEEVTNLHVSSLEGYTIEITPAAKISSVKITDVTAPVIGETVNFTATATATGAEKTNVRWFDWDENRYLSEGDVFKEGHAYMIVVTMNAMEGYAFNTANSTMTVTVNGQKGFLSRATQESVDCSYCFDAAYPAPVITTQPTYNTNINEGEGFSLHVEAENATSYEWHYVNQVGTDYVLEKQFLHYQEGTQNTDTLVMNYFDYNSRLGHIYCRVYGPGGYTDTNEAHINVLPVEYDLWVNGVQVTSENKKHLAYNGNGWATYLPYKNELRLWDGVKITSGSGERVDFSDGGFLESNPYGILYYTPAGKTARELTITVSSSVTADPYAINILKSADADGTASARIVGWNGKGTDTLTTANYPFRNGAYTVENCTVNITGCINVSSSLTLKNADVTATAPSASSYAINATNYSKTITVMGDSNLTLMGKDGGKAANLYPEPEYRAQQVLYPAYTTSVFLDATSPDGSNGANAWTDPTTEPNWNDYQYISMRTQNENTPVGMVQFKIDGVPTVGETAPSVSVVDAYADYVDGEATEYAWWLVEDGRVVSQLLDWSTLQPGRTYRAYAYAVAADGYSFAEYTVNQFKVYNEEGKVVDTPYGTIDRNRGDYANFYVEFTMPGEASAGVTVSGTATSFNSDTDDVIIQLTAIGASEPTYETVVYGNAASYAIHGVEAGTYTMKVMKQNHVTREYTVTVGDKNVIQNVDLCMLGDVNGDGDVNSNDYAMLKNYVQCRSPLTEEQKKIADINGDGAVDAFDAIQLDLYLHGVVDINGK